MATRLNNWPRTDPIVRYEKFLKTLLAKIDLKLTMGLALNSNYVAEIKLINLPCIFLVSK